MKLPLPLVLLLLFAPAHAGARQILIKPDGSGAFPTIMAAIGAASDRDTLTLAAGTYTGIGNRDLDFAGKELVLRAATSTPDSCIIDCRQGGRGFLLHSREPRSSQVVGLTITGGLAEQGGGVLLEESASTQFTDCVFRDNRATLDGGAIAAGPGLAQFNRCAFINNTAHKHGGAVYIWSCSGGQFLSCSFLDNAAPEGSAISCVGHSTLSLARCLVAFNGPGAGIQCRGGGSCTPTMERTNIFGNGGGDWIDSLLGLEEDNQNLSRDPLFVPPRGPRYRLAGDSPCRTADGLIGAPERQGTN
jgi:predicted outer membrane repeat protein